MYLEFPLLKRIRALSMGWGSLLGIGLVVRTVDE
ncbi:hypothetical protein M7I_0043 [Glarea lozoyensis 74030]|uniref:Uncharacterized protein n=1 Tax=Glarea lozoyensis (strain ATCC 74030 / MF5533) TaxID=1104152 RepID=H0ECA9_GLAL7|nr:hypothetical protein M7I_0043 [Glarea lozoyensis 74030]